MLAVSLIGRDRFWAADLRRTHRRGSAATLHGLQPTGVIERHQAP